MKNTKVIRKVLFAVFAITIISVQPCLIARADDSTNLEVNVKETLSVSVSTPATWASGDMDTFLRNKVSVSVTSNNAAGFTATMTTKTANTALVNTVRNTVTIPTLSANTTRSSFPANYWGYSLDDTDAGLTSSTYRALVGVGSTPITLLSSNTATSGSKDFFFGAKADATKASGTYINTVVISVVSGVIDNNNPVTPVDPVTPGSEEEPIYNPTGGGSSTGTTAYTYRRSNSTTSTTTTEVSAGDNRSVYDGYTPPQGVVNRHTKANVNSGTTLATWLGIATSVATASGFFFLAAARREGDDEDEE